MENTEVEVDAEFERLQPHEVTSTGWAKSAFPLQPGDGWTANLNGQTIRGVVPLEGFRPLHNQVVIRVLKDKEDPAKLVQGVESAKNRQHAAIGVVIAKGEGWRRRGKKILAVTEHVQRAALEGYVPLEVEPGDRVLVSRNVGEMHFIGGVLYLLTPMEHVLAVLDDYEAEQVPATEREVGLQSFIEKKWDRAGSEFPKVGGKHAQ
jgi:co-chaperonin GroES (HSP10)